MLVGRWCSRWTSQERTWRTWLESRVWASGQTEHSAAHRAMRCRRRAKLSWGRVRMAREGAKCATVSAEAGDGRFVTSLIDGRVCF